MRKNLLIQILDALSVKYTPEYATAFYEENPDKDNLYGLSKMLNAYGVETLVILLTVLCVPLALKLFAWVLARRIDAVGIDRALRLYVVWSTVRVLLLFLPALGGFLGYCLLLSNKCLLCGLIALVAMLFCVPGQKRLRSELHIDKEVEE